MRLECRYPGLFSPAILWFPVLPPGHLGESGQRPKGWATCCCAPKPSRTPSAGSTVWHTEALPQFSFSSLAPAPQAIPIPPNSADEPQIVGFSRFLHMQCSPTPTNGRLLPLSVNVIVPILVLSSRRESHQSIPPSQGRPPRLFPLPNWPPQRH